MKFDNQKINKFVMLSHMSIIMAKEVCKRKIISDTNEINIMARDLLYDLCESMNLSDIRDWIATDGAEFGKSIIDSTTKDEEYMSQVTNYTHKIMRRGDMMMNGGGWA